MIKTATSTPNGKNFNLLFGILPSEVGDNNDNDNDADNDYDSNNDNLYKMTTPSLFVSVFVCFLLLPVTPVGNENIHIYMSATNNEHHVCGKNQALPQASRGSVGSRLPCSVF